MRQFFKYIICMAVVMTAVHSTCRAEEVTASDLSEVSYAVYAQAIQAEPGDEVTLSLCMKNENSIATWQADLVLPEGVTVVTDGYGDPQALLSTTRTSSNRHSVTARTLSSGAIRILCSSTSNKTFLGTDGEVVTIALKISDEMKAGCYPITLKNEVMSEANETGHKVAEVISTLDVSGDDLTKLCDINKDGDVNIADVNLIISVICGTKK